METMDLSFLMHQSLPLMLMPSLLETLCKYTRITLNYELPDVQHHYTPRVWASRGCEVTAPKKGFGRSRWSLHSGTVAFIFRSKEGETRKRHKEKGVYPASNGIAQMKMRRLAVRMSSMLELVHFFPVGHSK